MEIHKGKKVAIIWGVEADFGMHLLERLLLHPAYGQIKVFIQNDIDFEHNKLLKINYSEIEHLINTDSISGNDLFICPNKFSESTSKKAFHHDNFICPAKVSKWALKNGVNQVFCLSNKAAKEESLLFQMRVLAALEKEILKMEFWSIHFFKPYFITKNINPSGFRNKFLSKIDKLINKVTKSNFQKITPTPFTTISNSMVTAAQQLNSGVFYYNDDSFEQNEFSKNAGKL